MTYAQLKVGVEREDWSFDFCVPLLCRNRDGRKRLVHDVRVGPAGDECRRGCFKPLVLYRRRGFRMDGCLKSKRSDEELRWIKDNGCVARNDGCFSGLTELAQVICKRIHYLYPINRIKFSSHSTTEITRFEVRGMWFFCYTYMHTW